MELTYEKEIRIMGNPIGQLNKTKHVSNWFGQIYQKWPANIKNE